MLLRIGPSSDQIRSAGVNRQTKARTRSSLANRVTVWAVAATAWYVGATICRSFIAMSPGVRDLLATTAGNGTGSRSCARARASCALARALEHAQTYAKNDARSAIPP